MRHAEIVSLATQAREIAEDVQASLLTPRFETNPAGGVGSLGLAVENLARAVEALAIAVAAS